MNYYRTLNEGFDKFVSEALDERPKNTRTFLGESKQLDEDVLEEAKTVTSYYINDKEVNEAKWKAVLASYDIELTSDQQKQLDVGDGREVKVEGTDFAGAKKTLALKKVTKEIKDSSKNIFGKIADGVKSAKADRMVKKATDASGSVRSDYKLTVSEKDGKFPLKLGDKVIAIFPNKTTVESVIGILQSSFDALE